MLSNQFGWLNILEEIRQGGAFERLGSGMTSQDCAYYADLYKALMWLEQKRAVESAQSQVRQVEEAKHNAKMRGKRK